MFQQRFVRIPNTIFVTAATPMNGTQALFTLTTADLITLHFNRELSNHKVYAWPFLGALYGALWATLVLGAGALTHGVALEMLAQRLALGLFFGSAAGALGGVIMANRSLKQDKAGQDDGQGLHEPAPRTLIQLFVSGLLAVVAVILLLGGLGSAMMTLLSNSESFRVLVNSLVTAAFPLFLVAPAALAVWLIMRSQAQETSASNGAPEFAPDTLS